MAITFGRQYEQICDFENLWKAYRKARRGKRYDPAVAQFDLHVEHNLLTLRDELVAREWTPGPYRSFYVHEPKKRLISAAPFRDRVVHHALVNVLEPLYEARFSGSSYACRKGKGTHAAIESAHWGIRNHRYYLKCDIVKFFPSVDHEVLKTVLFRKITDPEVRVLIARIVASGSGILDSEAPPAWFEGDELFSPLSRPRGLPIGNLTSQFFANVLLNELDQFVHAQIRPRHYVRYSDDLVLFDHDVEKLKFAKAAVAEQLGQLRLRPHPRKTALCASSHGLRFLGFKLTPVTRRLDRANLSRFRRRARRMSALLARGAIGSRTVTASVRGWLAHAAFGNCTQIVKEILGHVRFGTQGIAPVRQNA